LDFRAVRVFPLLDRPDHVLIDGVPFGDDLVFLGPAVTVPVLHPIESRISAEEMAALCGTINYETTCAISYRVPRILI
jgi:alanine racemase